MALVRTGPDGVVQASILFPTGKNLRHLWVGGAVKAYRSGYALLLDSVTDDDSPLCPGPIQIEDEHRLI